MRRLRFTCLHFVIGLGQSLRYPVTVDAPLSPARDSVFDVFAMSLPPNDTLPIGNGESNANSLAKQTTCCALLTGPGRAAIAVIELNGPAATDCLNRLFRPASVRPWKPSQIRYGLWCGPDAADSPAAESIVVLATADDCFEIHCHGGEAAVGRILHDLAALGVVQLEAAAASPQAIPQPVGPTRLIDEAVEVLSHCTTARTAAIVLDQVRGAMEHWRSRSLERLDSDVSSAQDIAGQANEIIAAGRTGLRLTRPLDVVLIGPPNVGKSSLINAMVGYDRSITMDLAGTTRDVLDAETVFDGWPIRLRDTAGLHQSDESIEQQGMQNALRAIQLADLIVQVTQPGVQLDPEPIQQVLDQASHPIPILRVVNKSDLAPQSDESMAASTINTVAITGEGIPALLTEITAALQMEVPAAGAAVPINRRQVEWLQEVVAAADSPQRMRECLQEFCRR